MIVSFEWVSRRPVAAKIRGTDADEADESGNAVALSLETM
jgi:hypothetical protein